MDPARFNELVASLSAMARENPAVYRRRVRLLVALGYSYALGILALLLAAIVGIIVMVVVAKRGFVAAKLLFLLVPVAILMVRSLWVRFPAPEGTPIDPAQVPRLAARLEEMRRKLQAPRIDVILVTKDFNAAVTQQARFGVFGGGRTYLILGLPYLYAKGPRQFDAVLAHELGHLSGEHPKYGLWLDRVSVTWRQLLGQLEAARGLGSFAFKRFVRWYLPQLNAHSYALRRDDEFAADADSARVTSARFAAQSLATGHVLAPHYDRYWKQVLAGVEASPLPPEHVWSELPAWMEEGPSDADRIDWLTRELATQGLVEDSHPRLAARLKALGMLGDPPYDHEALLRDLVPAERTLAAGHYLGPVATRLLAQWDREWREETTPSWKQRHEAVKKARARMSELSAEEAARPLAAPELWELSCLVEEFDGREHAVPLLERMVALDPAHAAAHFMLGRALLERRDAAGIPALERAMELDVQAMPAASQLLREYHAAIGDPDGVSRAESAAHAREAEYDEVVRERNEVTRKDVLVPAVLSVKDRAKFAAAARIAGVKAIWVARKQCRKETGDALLVIIVEPRSKFWSSFGEKRLKLTQAVAEALDLEGRIEPLFIPWSDGIDWIVEKVKKANGSRVTGRRGMKTVRRASWARRHRRPLILSGVGASLVAGALWMFHVPERIYDPKGILPAEDVPRWNGQLMALMIESGIDMRILIDSVPPGTDLSRLALSEARRLGMGRESDRRGLFLLVDVTSGSLRLEVGPTLEGYFPDGFVGNLLRAHTSGALRHDTMTRSLVSTIMVIQHRVREATLGLEYDPRAFSDIRDSTRLAAGAGATFTYAAGAPLELDRAPDPWLEEALGPGTTPEDALERYRQWLSLPVYVPKARFLTPTSRQFFLHEFKMTPLYWEHIRHLYVGTAMRVETRGDLAIAYATENPLVTPLFFRRGKDGWEMDTMAELLNSRNVIGGGYSWMLSRSGDAFDIAFADQMVMIDGIWRFAGGANQRYISRGTD